MRGLGQKPGKKFTDLKGFFVQYPSVAAVYLFGSFGTEHEHPFSDIDLGVIFAPEGMSLQEEMSMEACLSVLLARDRIDLVNLNKAPLKLQYRAIAEGELIFEGNYKAHSDFLERTYKGGPGRFAGRDLFQSVLLSGGR